MQADRLREEITQLMKSYCVWRTNHKPDSIVQAGIKISYKKMFLPFNIPRCMEKALQNVWALVMLQDTV